MKPKAQQKSHSLQLMAHNNDGIAAHALCQSQASVLSARLKDVRVYACSIYDVVGLIDTSS